MFDLSGNAGFLVAAYALVILVMAVMIGAILIDYRAQKRNLAALEDRGVRRRSAGTDT